ncbi:MAG: PEP-CTERM sorting domain-containing protein [Planctomycetota bacterium]|jgi:hypothetical protein
MKAHVLFLIAAIGLVSLAPAAEPPGWPAGAGWVELVEYSYIADGPEAGNYEYIYDFYGGSETFFYIAVLFYDGTKQVNVWQDPALGTVTQHWCAMSAGNGAPFNGYTDPDRWPSNWRDTDGDFLPEWDPSPSPWGMENLWHDGGDYGTHTTSYHTWREVVINANGTEFWNTCSVQSSAWMSEGLSLTYRVVHPFAPGTITYDIYNNYAGLPDNTVIGPAIDTSTRDGDFNNDTVIDAADIDLLADAIATGSTESKFDVNGDTFIDEQDLIDHIATLVERTDGGTGTYRGDFNLDGFVNGTDLAIFKAGFGLSGQGYAQGNANTDDVVNGTDLAIFKATFGFSGTPGDGGNPPAVPEPTTLAILGCGGLALFRRYRRA